VWWLWVTPATICKLAHSAGVLVVGVLSGAGDAEQLRAFPHYAIIPSVADLREALG